MLNPVLSMEMLGQDNLSGQDVCDVSQFYGIGPIQSWVKNSRGLKNSAYELDNNFFLNVYRRRTCDKLEAIAAVAHGMDDAIPITKPVLGKTGYSLRLASGLTLLNPRLSGMHYVGIAHT